MRPEIIVMLTHHDITVSNARELFRDSLAIPAKYWGFKDVGLSAEEATKLTQDIKDAGKISVLEVVSFNEKELLEAADFAVACGVDYFTGGLFSEAAMERVQAAGIKYYPFCGDVGGSPLKLEGTIDSIVGDAARILEAGADGIDLTSYRYADGDPIELTNRLVGAVGSDRLIVAGSINSEERIERLQEVAPFAFTMGGALFDGVFKPEASFQENLEYITNLLAASSKVN